MKLQTTVRMALQINRRKDEHFNKYFGTSGQQLKKKNKADLTPFTKIYFRAINR